MSKWDLKLKKLILFEIKKEQDVVLADQVGRVYDLQAKRSRYIHLIPVLEQNIKKKIAGDEAKDASKKIIKGSVITKEDLELESKGNLHKLVISPLENEEQKKLVKSASESRENQDFKDACASLVNLYADHTKTPKGLVGFVQFDFQISRGLPKHFLAILITDYSTNTVTVDPSLEAVLKYLEKTFKDRFRTTLIYPYITGVKDSKGKTVSSGLTTDEDKVKIHSEDEDSAVYEMIGAPKPRIPQKEVEKTYKAKHSVLGNIADMGSFVSKDDMKSTDVRIKINESTLKVDLDTFTKKYKLFVAKQGKGFLIKDAEIEVFLGKKNLLNEQKIKFEPIKDIFEDDNKEGA